MRRWPWVVMLATTLCCATPAFAQPVAMPPEIALFVPTNLRTYYVVFLTTPPQQVAMRGEVFVAHQNYMRTQVEAGHYRAMGPLDDAGAIRGIVIVEAASVDEARALVSGDPAVQAGVFGVEVHQAVLPDLSPVVIQYQPQH